MTDVAEDLTEYQHEILNLAALNSSWWLIGMCAIACMDESNNIKLDSKIFRVVCMPEDCEAVVKVHSTFRKIQHYSAAYEVDHVHDINIVVIA